MDRLPDAPRRLMLLIFISSLSCLAYELALIRIFSITLWYHFAFMVISIAMLGIGASGTLLSVAPSFKDFRRIPSYGVALAISIPVSYLLANMVPFEPAKLSWDRMQVLNIGLYYIILAIPFFSFGLIVSTSYSVIRERPGMIYASDLLGAGTGSILIFCLLFLGGPERAVFTASLLVAAALLLCVRGWPVRFAVLLAALDLFALVLQPHFVQPRMSPYKPLEAALRFPGAEITRTYHSAYARVDVFESPAARYAPGLSLTFLDQLPHQTGLSVDGGDLYAITDDRNTDTLAFLRYLPSGLPYILSQNNDIFVLEPKGGLAVLTAKYYRAKRISGIDSNPLVLQAVRDNSAGTSAFSKGVELHAGMGRSWLSNSARTFDVIDLSFMGSVPGANFGFSEDYRFTMEAFRIYMEHLKTGGVLSLNLYIVPPPRTELRLLASLAKAAEESGIKDISAHVAVIRSWGTLTVLFRNTPLSPEDMDRIKAFCKERRFDTVYYPGIQPDMTNIYVKMPNNEYFDAIHRIIDPVTRSQFIDRSLFDIRPVRDDSPFFHYYLTLGNIREIYRVMGEKWQYFFEEGYLLPMVFAQVLVISVILILLPLCMRTHAHPAGVGTGTLRIVSYFAAIGLGFLFIETVFIQKMMLVLEHPAYASGTVIASLLTGSGTGSFASQQMEWLRKPRTLLIVGGLCALSSAVLSCLEPFLIELSMPVRIFAVLLFFFPLGFFMGIPLPLGISLLQKSSPVLVPWALAVNGCFSVLAPILAVMLALTSGYSVVILTGAGLYISGYLFIRPLRSSLT